MLFLHGYLASKETFYYQTEFFSRYFRVIAVDMTGFGESPPMKTPYSVSDYAEEIKRVIDEIGEEKIDVVAHSFGGRVLVKLLQTEKRIDKIVLTGSAGLKPGRGIKYYAKIFLFKVLSKFVKKEKLKRFYSSDYLKLNEVMRESFKLIIKENLIKEYSEIQNRTLLIFGKKDKETPLYMAKQMRKLIKNSELVVLRKEGHFCFMENPTAFNGAVFSFLMRN